MRAAHTLIQRGATKLVSRVPAAASAAGSSARAATIASASAAATRPLSSLATALSQPRQSSRASSTRWLSLIAGSVALLAANEMRSAAAAEPAESGLSPKAFTPLTLVKREKYNHNTDIFTFALPDPNASLNLPVSACVMTRCTGADGKDVIRPYTPIDQDQKGHLVLLVKDYEKGVMSRHIHNLKAGDKLDFKGPMAKKAYKANEYASIGMVAGGTGITPCLQVLDEIISNPSDRTNVSLVFANQTPVDILLKERLDRIAKEHRNVKITYIVDQATSGWTGPVGHVSADLLSRTLPAPSTSSLVYVCGPPGFMNAVSGSKNMKDYSQGELTGALKQLGFTEANVFKF